MIDYLPNKDIIGGIGVILVKILDVWDYILKKKKTLFISVLNWRRAASLILK